MGAMAELRIKRRSGEVHTVLVDDEDYDAVVAAGAWCVTRHPKRHTAYVTREHRRGEARLLHRFLLSPPDGVPVDHVDGNGLNNKRSNLRLCTPSLNSGNAQKRSNNRSGVKGVSWDAKRCKWFACIRVNGKTLPLGRYTRIEDAAAAYATAAAKVFGEFANPQGVHLGRLSSP